MVLCCAPFFAWELHYDNTSPDYVAFPSLEKPLIQTSFYLGTQIIPILLSKQCMWKENIIISSNYCLIYLLWVNPHQFDESVPFPFVVAMTNETSCLLRLVSP